MLTLKALTVAVAGILSVWAFRHAMRQAEAVKVKARPDSAQRPMTRLRQDPRTGIYYPEN